MGERGVRRLKDVSPGAQAARRFVRTGMKDVRWVVGIMLLALGVLGTLRVIGSFDDSVQVWSAKSALVPGQRLTSSDLVPTRVRLDDHGGQYLSSATQPGGVVQRAVGAGELVPKNAVGEASGVTVRALSVNVERGQADVIRAGGDVEVWVSDKKEGAGSTGFDKPHQSVERALVSHVGSRSGGVVAVADGSPVEILVPRESLPAMIDAVNSGARITLVPLNSAARS